MKTWNIQTIFGIWFGFRDITLYIAGIWDAARKDVKVKQRPAVEEKQRNNFYQLITMLCHVCIIQIQGVPALFPVNQCWVDGGNIRQFHLAPLRASDPNRHVLWHCFSVAKNSTNSTNSNRRAA